MIANGAKYGSSDLRLPPLRKRSVLGPVQLQAQQESLRIGLLSERELQCTRRERLLCGRGDVIAASHDLSGQVVRLDRLSDVLRAAAVDREETLVARMRADVGLDRRE